MKAKVLFLACFLLFACSNIFAQKLSEDKVPQDVVISFKYKYSEATVISWELNKDIYIVKFKLNDQVGKANFDKKGVWIITQYDITEKELPSPIISYYKENYQNKDYLITSSQLQKTNDGESDYCLQLRKEGNTKLLPVDLLFDLTGKILKINGQDEAIADSISKQEQKPVVKHNQKEVKKQDQNEVKKQDQEQKADQEQKQEVTENKDKKHVKESGVKNKKSEEDETQEVVQKTEDPDKDIVDVSKVPAIAKTHFTSKMKKTTGVVWHLKDKNYIVNFKLSDQTGQATYTKDGEWIETRVSQPEATLHQLILSYLKENFKNYKLKTIDLVTTPKEKSIFIRMYDKHSKELPPPLTEIWFSTTGKLISVNKPDVTEPINEDEQKRKEEKDSKFGSSVDQKGDRFENADNYNDKIDSKELPTPILQYIKKNYKDQTIRSSRLFSDDSLGNVYRLSVWLEGSPTGTLLYFDLNGNFLKNENEDFLKNGSFKNKVENTKTVETPPSKYGTSDERVNEKELPPAVSKYLKKNYASYTVSESFFKTETEQGNCYLVILKKASDKKVIKVYFDLDGNYLKNETDTQ